MNNLLTKISFGFLLFLIFAEFENIRNPSDSGDMKWLNYEITKYKANRGDIRSKWHLLAFYKYNDDFSKGAEIASLIIEIINDGYGGLTKGGEGVVIDLIEECKMGRLIKPLNVEQAFELIKTNGGGLTRLGQDIEMRWHKGDFIGCPNPEN